MRLILSDTEIAAVKKIDCKGRAITNLKGIEYFTALEYLYCYDNELTELDLSRNTKLKELNCSTNRLTVLDLSQNPKLKRVICSDNALTALNLSSNSKLTDLNASGNIREITLTGNTFDLSSLTGFDVSKARNWQGGTVSGNTLTVDGNAAVVTYSYDLGYTGTELDDAEKDVIFTLAIAGRDTDIDINKTNFPDKDFRELLLDKEANIDRNQDGKLSTWEIALVQDIDVYDMEIADLTGIEYFTELKYLDCAGNHLTSLDLSRNTKLAELDAKNNTYTITPVNDRFYLDSLPAGFDVAKTSHWQGGTVCGNILTIDSDVDEVTYDYDCGKDFTTTFTLEIPMQYTVTAHGLYGGVMGITPGEDYTARYTVGAQVGLQIGKRDGFTLQGLTLEGISEEQLQWQAKDAESTTRGISFEMPAHNVTVTVNWKANGSSSVGGGGGGGGGSVSIPDTKIPTGIYEHGTVTVSPESASKGDTVTITVTPDKGYVLESLTVLDKDGKALTLTDKGGGKYTFVMPAGKVMVKAVFMDDNTMLNFFTDVHAEDYYYDAVLWAAQKGITGGMSDTLFAPNVAYTRAQIVTFLWRAAGSPEPKQLSTFGDVLADAYYAKAVAWAVENGITDGMSDTTFAPGTICTRAQGVALLYRAAGNPAVSGSAAFTDVPADAYYADAAAWAEQKGITGGIGNGLFGPHNNCTRAQIVTFLYRMYQDK